MNESPGPQLHDTHCHVDLFPDPKALVAACESRRVYTVAVTNTPSVFSATQALAAGTTYVRAALGLHPELVASRHCELPEFWSALQQTRYIGEVGLDYVTPDRDERAMQRRVLGQILEQCACAGDKIITLHSRRAAGDVIDAVGNNFPGRVILHWYTGSQRELKRAIDFGFHFSLNSRMMVSESSLRLVAVMPRERLLLETDGPFVTIDHRPAEPFDTRLVVGRLAEMWDVSLNDAADVLFANFRRLLDPPLSTVPEAGCR